MHLLLAMSGGQIATTLFIIFVCVLLILVVLLQKGRGGGLAGAFGGPGGAGGAFGAKTGDVFTWVTVVLAVVFLLMNVAGNYVMVFETYDDQPAAAKTTEAPTNETPDTADAPATPDTTKPETPASTNGDN